MCCVLCVHMHGLISVLSLPQVTEQGLSHMSVRTGPHGETRMPVFPSLLAGCDIRSRVCHGQNMLGDLLCDRN